MSHPGEFLALVFFLKFCVDVDEAYQENTIAPQSANVSILWVHISAHIVDLDILTMERPVKVRFAYNEEDNKDKKKNSGHTYKDQQQCNGGDSKSCISNKRKLIKLG